MRKFLFWFIIFVATAIIATYGQDTNTITETIKYGNKSYTLIFKAYQIANTTPTGNDFIDHRLVDIRKSVAPCQWYVAQTLDTEFAPIKMTFANISGDKIMIYELSSDCYQGMDYPSKIAFDFILKHSRKGTSIGTDDTIISDPVYDKFKSAKATFFLTEYSDYYFRFERRK
jgi:hypothetical protein